MSMKMKKFLELNLSEDRKMNNKTNELLVLSIIFLALVSLIYSLSYLLVGLTLFIAYSIGYKKISGALFSRKAINYTENKTQGFCDSEELIINNERNKIRAGVKRAGSISLFVISLLVINILFMESVLALGITPGRSVFDYIPGESHTIDFTVINSEARDTDFVVIVTGELNESIAVSEVSFHMTANEA